MKAFANPPARCALVMEAVGILLTSKKTVWADAQKLLGQKNVLDLLKSYDKDHISTTILKKLEPFMRNPDFEEGAVQKTSTAAAGLCKWVRAMYTYAQVTKAMEPKRRALQDAEARVRDTRAP